MSIRLKGQISTWRWRSPRWKDEFWLHQPEYSMSLVWQLGMNFEHLFTKEVIHPRRRVISSSCKRTWSWKGQTISSEWQDSLQLGHLPDHRIQLPCGLVHSGEHCVHSGESCLGWSGTRVHACLQGGRLKGHCERVQREVELSLPLVNQWKACNYSGTTMLWVPVLQLQGDLFHYPLGSGRCKLLLQSRRRQWQGKWWRDFQGVFLWPSSEDPTTNNMFLRGESVGVST